jgi:hypothetical protein
MPTLYTALLARHRPQQRIPEVPLPGGHQVNPALSLLAGAHLWRVLLPACWRGHAMGATVEVRVRELAALRRRAYLYAFIGYMEGALTSEYRLARRLAERDGFL